MRRRILLLAVVAGLVAVAACAHQPSPPPVFEVPGFWRGLVHGLIAPIALVLELFRDVRIYAFPNGGGWYDLGFMLGVAVWGRGSHELRRR
jgi:hypothetical protein